MRQIDWDNKLSEEDVAWLRQSGIRFGPGGILMEDAIRDNQGRDYEPGGADVDPTSRSALDPAAGAGVPFAQLSAEEQKARLDAGTASTGDEDPDDYDEWSKSELEEEIHKRNVDDDAQISVVGTGKGGTVLKSNLIEALRADDTLRANANADDAG